ncbi:PilZ domain-containing protein [Vibrio sp. S4M6]|uniref:PilZ domain-containing protein n=1 Tax=Vibrio sinus TaxID=2946865 RepID=UPI00202A1D7B|nr:PilZ domain-containing protein [Vibrio sinus]MCL9782477.1 PilZ domain-containing protein [Vibrio sinus]
MFNKDDDTASGEYAMSLVSSSSEIAFYVAAANNETLRCRTKYIGVHSQNLLLLESPPISPDKFSQFIKKGHRVKACALSQRGEGAKIYFKSAIEHIMPLGKKSILFISLPKEAHIKYGIRAEARLEIALNGVVNPESNSSQCEIRDFSGRGCQMFIALDQEEYQKEDPVELQIQDDSHTEDSIRLQGVIKNKKRSNQYWKYGVMISEESNEAAQDMLERLSFDQALHHFLL